MDSKQYNYQETRDSVKTMYIHVDMWHLLTLRGPAKPNIKQIFVYFNVICLHINYI